MSGITFDSVQKVFEEMFASERKIPTFLTLSEADHNALCEDIAQRTGKSPEYKLLILPLSFHTNVSLRLLSIHEPTSSSNG